LGGPRQRGQKEDTKEKEQKDEDEDEEERNGRRYLINDICLRHTCEDRDEITGEKSVVLHAAARKKAQRFPYGRRSLQQFVTPELAHETHPKISRVVTALNQVVHAPADCLDRAAHIRHSRSTLYRAILIARRAVFGDPLGSFAQLCPLARRIHRGDDMTRLDIVCNDSNCYVRSRLVLGSALRVLRGMRENACDSKIFISFDAAHMKTKDSAGGTLFIVCTVDPDDHVFPIVVGHAYDGESAQNWGFILEVLEGENLKEVAEMIGFVLMSDRGAGGLRARADQLSEDHVDSSCAFHISDNVKARFGTEAGNQAAKVGTFCRESEGSDSHVSSNLESTGTSSTPEAYYYNMSILAVMNKGAYTYLNAIDPKSWVKCFVDSASRSRSTSQVSYAVASAGNNLTNAQLSESANSVLLHARHLPISQMYMAVYNLVNEWTSKRQDMFKRAVSEKRSYGEKVTLKMRRLVSDSNALTVEFSTLSDSRWTGRVECVAGSASLKQFHSVDLIKRTCSCGIWQCKVRAVS
jgi:hypothetical protein